MVPQTVEAPTVSFVSLGCPKNLVDSEVILGHLAQDGFVLSPEQEGSDVVVINTCGFLQAAEREAMDHIGRAVKQKRAGQVQAVIVTGCLPQRHGPEFAKKLRDVDAVMGITDREEIVRVARTVIRKRGRKINLVTTDLPDAEIDRDRFRLTARHTAYLRLSEGCNHTCAFCIIPQIRGKFRSKPMEMILAEARELVADGAVELNLIAQDSTSYGLDLYRRLVLDELLAQLAEIDGLRWIRLLYAYPTYVNDRLIREMARNPKVVKYIDMPIQHTRERMLRGMRRGITETRQRRLIEELRAGIPGLVFRTTVIVGHPGETEEDFQGLMDDLRELRFERLGAFQYSREPGTRADELAAHVPEAVKLERFERLMVQQQEIAFEIAQSWIGRDVEVLLERRAGDGSSWEGRTFGDAPEIDPVIRVRGEGETGAIRRVRVIGADGYDLMGTCN